MALAAEEIDRLWEFENPAGSERAFRELLAGITRVSNEGAEVLTQVARAQGLQDKFEEAHRTLDEVQRLLYLCPPRVQVRSAAGLRRARGYTGVGIRRRASCGW